MEALENLSLRTSRSYQGDFYAIKVLGTMGTMEWKQSAWEAAFLATVQENGRSSGGPGESSGGGFG